MKKKTIIVVMILSGFGSGYFGLVCFSDGGKYPIEVVGNLTTNEVQEIREIARKQLRRQVLPNLSWASIKGIPQALKCYTKTKLLKIERVDLLGSGHGLETGGLVCVSVGTHGAWGRNLSLDEARYLKLGTNGWEWIGEITISHN